MDPTESTARPVRRDVSVWGSYMWGYADVGANLYIALGLVLAAAQGAGWLAFALAGLTYVLVGFGYTELASTYPAAGGGHYYALRGLGDFWGFVTGAALLLDYTVDIALFSVASIGYLRALWPLFGATTLGQGAGSGALHLGPLVLHDPLLLGQTAILIGILLLLNLRGLRASSWVSEALGVVDLLAECAVVVVGFSLAWSPDLLVAQWHAALHQLSMHDFAYGSSLAIISFVGLESISQAAEETRRPATVIPRTSIGLIFTVLFLALAFSTLTLGTVPWESMRDHASHPLAYLAGQLPVIGSIALPLVALLGILTLALSANSGIVGASRLAASMARLDLASPWFAQRHARYGTPSSGILLFSLAGAVVAAIATFTPHPLETLANLYAFGASLAYTLVFFSLIRLRFQDPFSPRPYKIPLNLGYTRSDGAHVRIPLLALIGLLGIGAIFVDVLLTHAVGRIVGPLWLGLLVVGYLVMRARRGLPTLGSVSRDWEREQIEVLTAAEEFDLLERYRNALARRDKGRA
jgi:APA family basic amino acid/polyamine antiporter